MLFGPLFIICAAAQLERAAAVWIDPEIFKSACLHMTIGKAEDHCISLYFVNSLTICRVAADRRERAGTPRHRVCSTDFMYFELTVRRETRFIPGGKRRKISRQCLAGLVLLPLDNLVSNLDSVGRSIKPSFHNLLLPAIVR